MILAAIIFLVCFGVAIYWKAKDGEGLSFMLFGLVIGITIMLILSLCIDIPQEDCIYNIETHKIISMRDNSMVSGQCALFAGTINSDMYYVYAEDNGDNSYSVKKISAEKARVFEEDINEPYFEIHSIDGFKHWYNYIFVVPLSNTRIIFHVPIGTLKTTFSVDLQ